MAPFQRTRFALFKRQEATKKKEIIEISDEESQDISEASRGWNIDYTHRDPVQDPAKHYCDMCIKEIEIGETSCDMCDLMGSCTTDYDLFGYDLNPNTPEGDGGGTIEMQEIRTTDEIEKPESEQKYCAFCGFELLKEEEEMCNECTLQAIREKEYNVLGYISYQYNISSPYEEIFSPATQHIEYIAMDDDEEEEDPEEEDPEEEEDDF